MIRMHLVDAFGCFTVFRIQLQVILNVYSANHQHIPFLLDLTCCLRMQYSFACGNLARIQRATKGTGESARCGSDDIIQGRCVGLVVIRIYTIVFSNL